MKRNSLIRRIVIPASLLYLAGITYYAQVRPIDGDEGFYTTAARLVWEGKTPYRDFFYTQAPLLPYLYSWIWAVYPRSLFAMRLLSAACGGIAVFLWGIALVSVEQLSATVALATFAVVLLNPYWVSWNVVVKTFAVSNLLITVAMISLYAALRAGRPTWYFVGGLALGACASERALYGPLIPAVLLWLLWREHQKSNSVYTMALTYFGGAACGLLPMMWSFVRNSEVFVFNNFQYFSLQAGYSLDDGHVVMGYQSAGHAALVYFALIIVSLLALHPYFTVEVVIAGAGILSWWRLRRRQAEPYSHADYLYFQLAFLMLVVYTISALLPFPPYEQYFDSPMLPFLLPFIAEGLRAVLLSKKQWLILLVLITLVLTWDGVRREPRNAYGADWQVSTYRKVAQAIDANSLPGDVVLSFWPGYVFESGRRYFPGMENPFVYRIMNKINAETRARFHVISKDQVMSAIISRAVSVVVVGGWMPEYYANLTPSEIEEFHKELNANYSLESNVDGVEVYCKR